MKIWLGILSVILLQSSFVFATSATKPSVEAGAVTFNARCTLCHGSIGMGEGALPMALKNYPQTNLLEAKYGTSSDALRENIIWGGSRGKMNAMSPPWGNELTWTEIESTILFIQLLHQDTEKAIALLKSTSKNSKVDIEVGRGIFQGRCAMCHGKTGEGNGKMAKIIKNPPPYNLTLSIVNDDYLKQIITKGGAAMKRSYRMPPWGDELSATELESVILYIKAFRKY